MKPFKKIVVSSLLAAALLGSSVAGAAGLKADALLNVDGRIMADITTYAGIGDFNLKNGNALNATFRSPGSIVVLADGSVLVADTRDHVIRKISAGQVSTFAGPELVVTFNEQGFPEGGLLDGQASESFFNEPMGLAADAKGNVYVADAGNNAIRKIDSKGKVTTLAGNGVFGLVDGEGGAARFNHPSDVVAAADGTLYVADTKNNVIRKISLDGKVSTLNSASDRAIQVRPGAAVIAGDYKDGSLKEAKFNEPSGLAVDSKGNLFVSDTGNQRIRYIDFSLGVVTTVAGSGMEVDGKSLFAANALYAAGDYADGDALKAKFDFPKGIAVTSEGGLLIADSLNHAVRYLLNGKVSTLTGTIETGETNGVEGEARFNNPSNVAVAGDGTILVADAFNNKIRQITPYQLPQSLPVNDSVKVVHRDSVIKFEVQPEIVNGRTMVPVRAISEALGYEVTYSNVNGARTVQLKKGNVTIELYIDKTGIKRMEPNKPDVSLATDAAPYIKKDNTYVPVRFFAEQIGKDVQWDQQHRTAIIR
ncbi:NHL domain-containing protein [Paenibacillus eucommiae]|uniref:Sugar lactone lactonase YvrE n=1 Tax=Paenibacillus eucommiae TaxID=1355755 RepID=A0ABS4INZ8_9BACL|nr:stalk domain-containing protein [Paenibacillus eucommiae]MBP1989240.1 sugar lactone lactonase YvrE [Paenibacillus eucommiae]